MKQAYESDSYKAARDKAAGYTRDPGKLQNLLDRAWEKMAKQSKWLADVQHAFIIMLHLLRAYAKGQYREIPWRSLLMITAAVVYFVMPVDFIPDFVFGIGLLDDVAVIGWTLAAVKADIERFLAWEIAQAQATVVEPEKA
ncbi:MAG TPA: YkvA family protein [Saprospiraceae bacterium]|nr:YkvA family protein [Saprospiraceae bacterium]